MTLNLFAAPGLHIGFTGTQRGMTHAQDRAVDRYLRSFDVGFIAHHGDCIGADADFHRLVVNLRGCRGVVRHLPDNDGKRAFCSRGEMPIFDREPRPYLVRNHAIVDESQIMIAAPGEHTEQLRSGTWATIRYAKKKLSRNHLRIFWPNGEFDNF